MKPSIWSDVVTVVSAVSLQFALLDAALAQETTSSAPICENVYLDGIKEALGEEWTKFVSEVAAGAKLPATTIEKGAAVIGVGSLIFDNIYASLLRTGVRVTFITPDEQTAHFGPIGHPSGLGEPGQAIRFTVNVSMKLALPENFIACAELAGYKIPKKGGIEGIPILWSPELGSQNLSSYGTVSYEPANQKTDSEGSSTLVFTPDSELDRLGISGVGKETVKAGTLLANPLVLTGINSSSVFKPGSASQLFWGITTNWNVAFHRARGFKFEEIHFQMRRPQDGFTADWWMSGQICGSTPWDANTNSNFGNAEGWSKAWTIKSRAQTSLGSWRSTVSSSEYFQPMRRSENGATWNIGSGGKITYLIQPRFPPKMVVEMVPWTGYPAVTQSIVTVPLLEDTSCPETDEEITSFR